MEAVCRDIVQHYTTKVAPLGLKGQVVAYSRELCVSYKEALTHLLPAGMEAEVVMTADAKGEEDWAEFDRTRAEENKIKARFQDPHDPLKLLIVTDKLLTGFDAPIEEVMYLDKPMFAHTLFQAVCRTNRRYTNPDTGQEKVYGLVVDYVGVGPEIVKALQPPKEAGRAGEASANITELYARLRASIGACLKRFEGLDRTDASYKTLLAAQELLKSKEEQDAFAAEFLTVHGLFEFLWPDAAIRDVRDDYQWLAKIYRSVQPSGELTKNALLWQRLGAKTEVLVHEAIGGVTVGRGAADQILIDAATLAVLKKIGIPIEDGDDSVPSVSDIMDGIAKRIKQRLNKTVQRARYEALSARLEELRRAHIEQAQASVEFIEELLKLARDLIEADRAEEKAEGGEGILDPNLGALTQIFNEVRPDDTPQMVDRIVRDIDGIVRQVTDPWRSSQMRWVDSRAADRAVKLALRNDVFDKYGLEYPSSLYDQAYAYVREHY